MADEERLSPEEETRLAAIRREIEDAEKYLSTLGDGGWNHGAKIIEAVEAAKASLRAAKEALKKAIEP